MTGNDENGGGMNQSIIESATREHVYTGFVDPRKCSTQKELFLSKHMIHCSFSTYTPHTPLLLN